MNYRSREGQTFRWLIAGVLFEAFTPGPRNRAVCAVFSVTLPSSMSHLSEVLFLGADSVFLCGFDNNGLSTGSSVCVGRLWLGRSSFLVSILELCGGLVPESSAILKSAILSRGLRVETVRKKGIPDCEGRWPSVCTRWSHGR